MARTKIASITIAAVALFAALALVVGCSSSSSSSSASAAASSTASAAASSSASAQKKTLESFITANQADWSETVAGIKEQGGDVLDVEVTVSGNTLTQIMTFKQTYSPEEVDILRTSLAEQTADIDTKIMTQLKTMQIVAEAEYITWVFEYRNGDGTLIHSAEVSTKE